MNLLVDCFAIVTGDTPVVEVEVMDVDVDVLVAEGDGVPMDVAVVVVEVGGVVLPIVVVELAVPGMLVPDCLAVVVNDELAEDRSIRMGISYNNENT